jgi:hypothetical protein
MAEWVGRLVNGQARKDGPWSRSGRLRRGVKTDSQAALMGACSKSFAKAPGLRAGVRYRPEGCSMAEWVGRLVNGQAGRDCFADDHGPDEPDGHRW